MGGERPLTNAMAADISSRASVEMLVVGNKHKAVHYITGMAAVFVCVCVCVFVCSCVCVSVP